MKNYDEKYKPKSGRKNNGWKKDKTLMEILISLGIVTFYPKECKK